MNDPTTRPESAGRRMSRARSRAFRAIWYWHFWSSLVATPVLIVASLTGAIYVFKPELERWFAPERRALTQDVGGAFEPEPFEGFRARLLDAEPGHVLSWVTVSADPTQAWEGIAGPREGDPRAAERGVIYAYYDPNLGRLLDVRDDREGFFGVVLELHRSLYLGIPGRLLVETTTGWTIVSVIAGIYLWWPRRGRGAGGVWVPRHGRGTRIALRDWHTIPGVYLAPIALAVLLSGLLFTPVWGPAYRAANALTGGFPDFVLAPPQSGPVADEADPPADLSIDAAVARARTLFDFSQTGIAVEVPRPGTRDAYQITTEIRSPLAPLRMIFLDRTTGEPVRIVSRDDLPWRTRLTLLFYPVHVGNVFGLPTQVLAVLACFVLISCGVTGVWLWWRRRPAGTWGAPVPPASAEVPRWVPVSLVLLGLGLPTVGASLLLALTFDHLRGRWTH